jgi:hypothetical protein
LISFETVGIWLRGILSLVLLYFFRDVRHSDSTERIIMINNPTAIPITSQTLRSRMAVFFDNSALRSVAIFPDVQLPTEFNKEI